MENGPVTGALASLLMATAGDVVSASTQLSCAPPPASNASSAARSAGSTDNPYSNLTAMTWAANHAPCRAGVHLSGVAVTLLGPVHSRIRDREVVQVRRDVPAPVVSDSAVVRLGERHDVLDVRRRGPVRPDVGFENRCDWFKNKCDWSVPCRNIRAVA